MRIRKGAYIYIYIENLSVLYPTGNFQNPIMAKNEFFVLCVCVFLQGRQHATFVFLRIPF